MLPGFASGARPSANSNCFEIDDGTRNIIITDCVAIGGICGLQVKGHNYSPAPYNVQVSGFRAVNNTIGVEIRNTGYYGNVADDDLVSETTDEFGNLIVYGGASPTGRNITLSNIEVIAPRQVSNYLGTFPALYAMRIRSYENIILDNIRVSDGTLDVAGDYLATTVLMGHEGAPIRIYGGAGKVLASNISIIGFASSLRGLSVSGSFTGPLIANNVNVLDGPDYAIRFSGATATYDATINNFCLVGTKPLTPAIYVTAPKARVGNGYASGYDRMANIAAKGLEFRNLQIRRRAESTGNGTVAPAEAISLTWHEGVQDLGAGEGMRIVWYAQLEADASPVNIGNVGFRKADAGDSSRVSDFFVSVSIDGVAAPVDRITVDAADGTVSVGRFKASGRVTLSGIHGPYADNAAAITAGLAVGESYRTATGVVMVRF